MGLAAKPGHTSIGEIDAAIGMQIGLLLLVCTQHSPLRMSCKRLNCNCLSTMGTCCLSCC